MGLMLGLDINTEGMDTTIARLPEMDAMIAESCAYDIDDAAELAVPILSGNLAASGGIWLSGGQWINYFKAYYAFFVEMGTKFMRAQSFLRIAMLGVDWIGNVVRAAQMIGL